MNVPSQVDSIIVPSLKVLITLHSYYISLQFCSFIFHLTEYILCHHVVLFLNVFEMMDSLSCLWKRSKSNELIDNIKRISIIGYSRTVPSNRTLRDWMTFPLIPYLNTFTILSHIDSGMTRVFTFQKNLMLKSIRKSLMFTVWKCCNCYSFSQGCTFNLSAGRIVQSNDSRLEKCIALLVCLSPSSRSSDNLQNIPYDRQTC